MRPNTGLDRTIPRSRKSSASETNLGERLTASTTYFLTRDPESSTTNATQTDSSPIRSLKETTEEADKSNIAPAHRQQDGGNVNRRRSTIKPPVLDIKPDLLSQQHQTSELYSGPAVPSLPSHDASLPSSPKSISSRSLQRSDDENTQDEVSSQAVASSDEERDDENSPEIENSAPQLIMPSIKMPSRRPFTYSGKQLGRYKVLVAGSKGAGKTSLIKSIVQLCEDIVHVDPLSSSGIHDRSNSVASASAWNEIHASTKPYPSWWSDVDESRILKRRKSMGDAVLERNICFVDTKHSGRPERLLSYLEQQLVKTLNSANQTGGELVNLLSGKGGAQVDLVLYLITKETMRDDAERIRRIAQLCNVVPLISKSDLLPAECITELKNLPDLTGISLNQISAFASGIDSVRAQAPYTVSSANGPDFDNMDASLLMSPEYVQPLMASELSALVEQIFDPATVAYLRHSSAKKLVNWYVREPRLTRVSSPSVRSPQPSTLNSPSLAHSGVLIPLTSELSLTTSNSYALAKVADHTQREEYLAQVRLSKWASDLQLSLQRERERYESLARGERALWLVQKMGEEICDGQVVPVDSSQAVIKVGDKTRLIRPETMRYDMHDPLGLLQWQDMVRTRGWIVLQVMGSFGVVGGIALWIGRQWGLTASIYAWAQDLNRSWFDVYE